MVINCSFDHNSNRDYRWCYLLLPTKFSISSVSNNKQRLIIDDKNTSREKHPSISSICHEIIIVFRSVNFSQWLRQCRFRYIGLDDDHNPSCLEINNINRSRFFLWHANACCLFDFSVILSFDVFGVVDRCIDLEIFLV